MKTSTLPSSRATATTPDALRASRKAPTDTFSRDELIKFYRTMLLSRRIDDKEIQLKNQSLIFFQISGAGHEAIMVAAGLPLRPGYDWFYPYYRDRALCLALGMTPYEMFLSGVGAKDDPNSGGRQMPSHWGHKALNIVSQSEPDGHAVPAGRRLRGSRRCSTSASRTSRTASASSSSDEVVYVSLGDGTTSEGEFWESLSTGLRPQAAGASSWSRTTATRSPCPSKCRRLAAASPRSSSVARPQGASAATAPTSSRAIARDERSRRLVPRAQGPGARAREGASGPYSHSLSDDEKLYKTPAERADEATRDPITKFAATAQGRRPRDRRRPRRDREGRRSRDRRGRRRRAQGAEAGARTPPACGCIRPTSIRRVASFDAPAAPEGKPDTMVAAINRTLKDEMAQNPRIVVFGEDVADATHVDNLTEVQGKGGVFKVTHGLQRAFGSDRVFNSPLAEANIIGRAVGMATRGIKPVVEIQFFDYIWPAMMQIRNEVSMLRYRSSNNFSCPMVIRTAIGGYLRGGAPYHSQSGESIFAHCPGLRVVYPSNAQDAAGLLRTSIRCDDPVLFLEHKHLYRQTYNKGEYPGTGYMIPFGKAATRRDGTDVVVVTCGALVQRSLLAAQQAEKDGISTMVIDLRTICPVRLGRHRRRGQEDEPHRHRARGSAHVRLRRGAGRARGERPVRVPRRAGQARRRDGYAGGVLSGSRGSDPAGLGRCPVGHCGNREVLSPSSSRKALKTKRVGAGPRANSPRAGDVTLRRFRVEPHDHHADVIAAARLVRLRHEFDARRLRIRQRSKRRSDRVVRQHLAQAVRTQQEPVAGVNLHRVGLRP